jgi:hypothetical protein
VKIFYPENFLSQKNLKPEIMALKFLIAKIFQQKNFGHKKNPGQNVSAAGLF